jgi:hypothetical protein
MRNIKHKHLRKNKKDSESKTAEDILTGTILS